jgi:hypothetical protein
VPPLSLICTGPNMFVPYNAYITWLQIRIQYIRNMPVQYGTLGKVSHLVKFIYCITCTGYAVLRPSMLFTWLQGMYSNMTVIDHVSYKLELVSSSYDTNNNKYFTNPNFVFCCQYSTLNFDYYVRHRAIQVHLWGKLYSSTPCTWAVVNIQYPYLICCVYLHPAPNAL